MIQSICSKCGHRHHERSPCSTVPVTIAAPSNVSDTMAHPCPHCAEHIETISNLRRQISTRDAEIARLVKLTSTPAASMQATSDSGVSFLAARREAEKARAKAYRARKASK